MASQWRWGFFVEVFRGGQARAHRKARGSLPLCCAAWPSCFLGAVHQPDSTGFVFGGCCRGRERRGAGWSKETVDLPWMSWPVVHGLQPICFAPHSFVLERGNVSPKERCHGVFMYGARGRGRHAYVVIISFQAWGRERPLAKVGHALSSSMRLNPRTFPRPRTLALAERVLLALQLVGDVRGQLQGLTRLAVHEISQWPLALGRFSKAARRAALGSGRDPIRLSSEGQSRSRSASSAVLTCRFSDVLV